MHGKTASTPSFLAKFLAVFLGVGAGQLIHFCCMPIISRIYAESDFGALALMGTFLALAVDLAGLRFVTLIPLPRSDRRGFLLLLLSARMYLLAAGLLLLAMFVAPLLWSPSPDSQYRVLYRFRWLLPIGLLVGGIYECLKYWNTRNQNFRLLGRYNIAYKTGLAATQIALGLAGAGTLGLLVGYLAGRVCGGIAMVRPVFTVPRKWWRTNARIFRSIVSKYWSPAFGTLGTVMLGTLGNFLTVFLFTVGYGLSESGAFSFALAILTAPQLVAGRTLTMVFYGEAAKSLHSNPYTVWRLFVRLSLIALAAVMPILVVMVGWGPDLFTFFFGEKWRGSGEWSRILVFSCCAGLVRQAMENLPLVLGAMGWTVNWSVARASFLVAGLALVIFVFQAPPIAAVVVYALVTGFSYIVFLVKMGCILRAKTRRRGVEA